MNKLEKQVKEFLPKLEKLISDIKIPYSIYSDEYNTYLDEQNFIRILRIDINTIEIEKDKLEIADSLDDVIKKLEFIVCVAAEDKDIIYRHEKQLCGIDNHNDYEPNLKTMNDLFEEICKTCDEFRTSLLSKNTSKNAF